MGLFKDIFLPRGKPQRQALSHAPHLGATKHGQSVNDKKFVRFKLDHSEFKKWADSSTGIPIDQSILLDRSKFLARFFDLLSLIPIVSGSIWAWKWIVFTDQKFTFIGGTDKEQEQAKKIISDLDGRISPFTYMKGSGFNSLLDQYFQALFTYGRFSSSIELSPLFDEISDLKIIDGFDVYFQKKDSDIIPFITSPTDPFKVRPINPNKFFYHGLNATYKNPYGSAMIESALSLLEIAEEMLQDMRQSSHNAGLPRLHIKVAQPDILDSEKIEEYESRINTYFDSTVSEMSEIGPDDNFYSWDDVTIGAVQAGVGPAGFIWKANRGVIEEEIITAFHLFPWILGKSSSTTKTWVRSQFDLIMNQADSIQRAASKYVEWIANTELKLKGITTVVVQHNFSQPRDPAAKDLAIAERFKIQNVTTLVNKGYISPDDAARRLGQPKAYDPDRIYASQKIKKTKKEEKDETKSPINKDD